MLGKVSVRLAAIALTLGILAGCAPTANFVVDKDEGGAPLTVQFTDRSATYVPPFGNANALIPIRSWLWDFGDGVTSEQRSPKHTYSNQGTYTVSLTVGNRYGVDTETREDTIKVIGTATGAKANFTAAPRTGVAPLAVAFTNTTEAGGAAITGYEWDFGDTQTSTAQNPSHTFEEPGLYTVTLVAHTTIGATTITKQDFINVAETPRGPQANFTEDKVQGPAPLSVKFTDLSVAGDAAISAWAWDFGDEGTSTSQNPTHVYNEAGTYTVSLTVTTSLGSASRKKTSLITVTAPAEK